MVNTILNNKETHLNIQNENKTFSLYNRRYLGNKRKILSFIKEIVDQECNNIKIIADLFSGTGSVASLFLDKKILTNDILFHNYISNYTFFIPDHYNKMKILSILEEYNNLDSNYIDENYMSLYFTDTYYNNSNSKKIGFIREDIEQKFINRIINKKEYYLLITSLIYAMDKIANTCGHYDAYIQKKDSLLFQSKLELLLPNIKNNLHKDNRAMNEDINNIISKINTDLLYLDPPYNSRQYSDLYHLLENVAKWEKPNVYGKARKMNRANIKSKFSSTMATKFFKSLVDSTNARYILLSYNSTQKKYNNRSNAKISDEDIFSILKSKGTVKIFEISHKIFSSGKSNIQDNRERLFLCKVK